MDPRSIAAFLAVADTLHFNNAAKRLGMSQPSLSVRIRRLEDEIGFQLFDRSATGVALTKNGAVFLTEARRQLDLWSGLSATAGRIKRGSFERLRVGVTPIGLLSQVPEIIQAWSRRFPEVHIDLVDAVSNELERQVAQGVLDIAFVHPPLAEPTNAQRTLFEVPLVAVLRSDHAQARNTSTSLVDLGDDTFIVVRRSIGPAAYDRIITACMAAGFSPRIGHEVTTSLALIGLVAAGAGVGLVIEPLTCVQRPGVAYVPLDPSSLSLSFAISWRDPAFERLADEWAAIAEACVPARA